MNAAADRLGTLTATLQEKQWFQAMTTPQPVPAVAADAGLSPEAFLDEVANTKEWIELGVAAKEAEAARHADGTQASYNYWLGRFNRWLAHPASRFRLRDNSPVDPATLWPIDDRGETLIFAWLLDTCMGPVDKDENEAWADHSGAFSPSTLTQTIAALKARSVDFTGRKWKPSARFSSAITGLRRQLRDSYGSDRQAEPLLDSHVVTIATHLHETTSPDALRDRLLLEMCIAGLSLSEITRMTLDSPRHPQDTIAAVNHDGNLTVFVASGHDSVGLTSLVVPGRRYRGGSRAPSRLITLQDHPDLADALDAYLEWRRTATTTDDHLVVLAASNPIAHARNALRRLARIAHTEWQPSSGPPSKTARAAMRHTLDTQPKWGGQLRRRRDQVMLLVGFNCALRRSELCNLTIADVDLRDRRGVLINIRKSKTDQDAAGHKVGIARDTNPNPATDTAGLLEEWIDWLRNQGAVASTPLFPALTRHGSVQTGHHTQADGSAMKMSYSKLDPQSWSDRLRELAEDAAVFEGDHLAGERYARVSGHSLRRGLVTTLLLRGISAARVAKRTRHKDIAQLARYADELRLLEQDLTSELFGLAHADNPANQPATRTGHTKTPEAQEPSPTRHRDRGPDAVRPPAAGQ